MVKISVDSRELERKLKSLTEQLKKEADESIISMAQIGANQLAIRSRPYGNDKKSQDIAEKAIYKDINKVYKDFGSTYAMIKKLDPKKAKAYAFCMNNNEEENALSIAQSVIGSSFTLGAVGEGDALERHRTTKGRVGSVTDPLGVKEKAEIETLKTKKKISAGLAKSGWIQAGISILSKTRVPAWLKKSIGNLGSSEVVKSGWNTTVTLINHVRYASENISDEQIQKAIQNAYKSHIKRLEKIVEALARKF